MIVKRRKCEFGCLGAIVCSIVTGPGHGRTADPDCAAVAERPTTGLASACNSHGLPESDLSFPSPAFATPLGPEPSSYHALDALVSINVRLPSLPLSPLHSRGADRCLAIGPMQQVSRLSWQHTIRR